LGLNAEYSVTPALHLLGALGQHDNGDPATDAATAIGVGVGVYWAILQNLSLKGMIEGFNGDATTSQFTRKSRWTAQLETAF
jgi:hypothetical protein